MNDNLEATIKNITDIWFKIDIKIRNLNLLTVVPAFVIEPLRHSYSWIGGN